VELRDYAGQDAVGLADLVRAGEVTALEVEGTARRAIEAVDPALHATVGDLLEPADGGVGDGPLAGVPFALKDVAPHLRGQIVQYGSRWTGDGLSAQHDSYLGRRFRAAGLRVIARSRSPEFAFNATTEPKAHGPTHNPWDVTRSAGGSSGGAAALVAARALPIAHATDAAGSIRIPSSLCGVVGMKPTRSRIPIAPNVWESVHGLAHDFVIARTLRDVAAALDALHGPVPGDKYLIPPPARHYVAELGADPGRLRIRWTADAWSGCPVAPECRAAVEATARALDAAGHDVAKGTPAIDAEELQRTLLTIWAVALAQRAAVLEQALGRPPSAETVEGVTMAMIERGNATSAVELLDSYGGCNAVSRSIGAFFETADVLVLPSTGRPAWRLGELNQDDTSARPEAWIAKLFDEYCPFTAMFNITGQPAISLPLAWTDVGLPIGVQLVGRFAAEATLLRLACQLEALFPWVDRIPPVAAGTSPRPSERDGRSG
jgi:amidase